jgi:TonB family protein
VVLQVTVKPDGSVTDIQVLKSPDEELSGMATVTVRGWRLNPARRADGEPVTLKFPIEVTFRLAR